MKNSSNKFQIIIANHCLLRFRAQQIVKVPHMQNRNAQLQQASNSARSDQRYQNQQAQPQQQQLPANMAVYDAHGVPQGVFYNPAAHFAGYQQAQDNRMAPQPHHMGNISQSEIIVNAQQVSQLPSNRSNSGAMNTAFTNGGHMAHRSAGSQSNVINSGDNSARLQHDHSQNQTNNSSRHRRSKKKHSGRLPPPKVPIIEPNFAARHTGADSSSYRSNAQSYHHEHMSSRDQQPSESDRKRRQQQQHMQPVPQQQMYAQVHYVMGPQGQPMYAQNFVYPQQQNQIMGHIQQSDNFNNEGLPDMIQVQLNQQDLYMQNQQQVPNSYRGPAGGGYPQLIAQQQMNERPSAASPAYPAASRQIRQPPMQQQHHAPIEERKREEEKSSSLDSEEKAGRDLLAHIESAPFAADITNDSVDRHGNSNESPYKNPHQSSQFKPSGANNSSAAKTDNSYTEISTIQHSYMAPSPVPGQLPQHNPFYQVPSEYGYFGQHQHAHQANLPMNMHIQQQKSPSPQMVERDSLLYPEQIQKQMNDLKQQIADGEKEQETAASRAHYMNHQRQSHHEEGGVMREEEIMRGLKQMQIEDDPIHRWQAEQPVNDKRGGSGSGAEENAGSFDEMMMRGNAAGAAAANRVNPRSSVAPDGDDDGSGSGSSYYDSESDSFTCFRDDPSADAAAAAANQPGAPMHFYNGPSASGFYNNGVNAGYGPAYNSRESQLLPLKFAKEHIVKIEQDMQKMKVRFVKLMREMDQNSKLIEEETKEYYVEFLKKWREVAKQRIQMHRKNTESLMREKDQIERDSKSKIDALNKQITELTKDRQTLRQKLIDDIKERDNVIELERLQYDSMIKKKDNEVFTVREEARKNERLLEEQLEAQRARVDSLNQQVEQAQNEEEQRLEELTGLRAQVSQADEEREARKADMKRMNSELMAQRQQLVHAQAENVKLRKSLDEKQSSLEDLKKQLEQVQQRGFFEPSGSDLQHAGTQGNQGQGQGNGGISARTYATVPESSTSTAQQPVTAILPGGVQQKVKLMKRPGAAAGGGLRSRYPTSELGNMREPSVGSTSGTGGAGNSSSLQPAKLTNAAVGTIKFIGGGGKSLLKPGILKESAPRDGNFNTVTSGGTGAAALSLKSKQAILRMPMSEVDYQNKCAKIQKDYQQKLDDVQVLLEHFRDRTQSHSQLLASGSDKGPFEPGSSQQVFNFDQRIKERLEAEESLYKKQLNDELSQLKRSYDQGQQIQRKLVMQNRTTSLTAKRTDLNTSNLEVATNVSQKTQMDQPYQNYNSGNMQTISVVNMANQKEEKKVFLPLGQGTLAQQPNVKDQMRDRQVALLGASNSSQNPHHNINSAREPAANPSLRLMLPVEGMEAANQTHTSVLNELKLQIQNLTKENNEKRALIENLQQEVQSKSELERELQEVRISMPSGYNSVLNSQLGAPGDATQLTKMQSSLNQCVNPQHEQLLSQMEELKREHQTKKLQYAENSKLQLKRFSELKTLTKQWKDKAITFESKLKINEKVIQQAEEVAKKHRNDQLVIRKQHEELRKQNDRLWLKYHAESVHRKRLHNALQDMKGKIRVYCRVRPMNASEAQLGCIDAIQIIDEFTLRIRVKKEQQLYASGQKVQQVQSQYSVKEFMFDACFGPDTSQDKIFDDTRMLIQSAIDGFNVCIFAYGQTGSGKTYTVSGGELNEQRGIVPRGFHEMFNIKQRLEKDGAYQIQFQCYMVELYLDRLNDLLYDGERNQQQVSAMNQDKLDIREDPVNGMIYIQNARHKTLHSFDDALMTFNQGMRSRRVAATEMNDASSRSHLIFGVVVEARNVKTGELQKGKISFVDLAGSERGSKANPTGNAERQREANHINQSLAALGNVISTLSREGDKAQPHIYRSHTLTKLMKDSLGGSAKTLMFVNVSPADYNANESLNSLRFGENVKTVTNKAKQNIESDTVQRLRQEVEEMRRRLGH